MTEQWKLSISSRPHGLDWDDQARRLASAMDTVGRMTQNFTGWRTQTTWGRPARPVPADMAVVQRFLLANRNKTDDGELIPDGYVSTELHASCAGVDGTGGITLSVFVGDREWVDSIDLEFMGRDSTIARPLPPFTRDVFLALVSAFGADDGYVRDGVTYGIVGSVDAHHLGNLTLLPHPLAPHLVPQGAFQEMLGDRALLTVPPGDPAAMKAIFAALAAPTNFGSDE